MRIYQLKIDSADEGEVIRWFSCKADAEAAAKEHAPLGAAPGREASTLKSTPSMCLQGKRR